MLPALNLPDHALRIEDRGMHLSVLCIVRRKWVVLTPEEWVRQHLAAYLHYDLQYPLSLMKLERQVKGGSRIQRADISIHDNTGKTLMLVECKAPDETLDRETFFQAGRYNRHLEADFILISNGLQHFCCKRMEEQFNFLQAIPFYCQLSEDLP